MICLYSVSCQPDFHNSVYFLDECNICMSKYTQVQLMVWLHRADIQGHPHILINLMGAHGGVQANCNACDWPQQGLYGRRLSMVQ